MRSRNIKPGLFKNEVLAECSPLARILWIGLWCYADREGRFEFRPKRIKAEILPYDNGEITVLLQELQKHGFVIMYEVNGIQYGQVSNFQKHQHPHHTEKASEIPDFDINGEITVKQPLNNGDNPSDSLIPDSLIQENGKPPNGGAHFSNHVDEYLERINKAGRIIQVDCPEVWKFIQIWIRKEFHPGAICEVLEGAAKTIYKPEIKNKAGYLQGIMKTVGPNWREKDFVKSHDEIKSFYEDILKKLRKGETK